MDMEYRQNLTGQYNPEIEYTDDPYEQELLKNPVGRWGRMWQEWVRIEYPTEVAVYVMECKWQIIPRQIDIEVEKRFDELSEQYRHNNPRPKNFEEIRRWEKTRLLTVEH